MLLLVMLLPVKGRQPVQQLWEDKDNAAHTDGKQLW